MFISWPFIQEVFIRPQTSQSNSSHPIKISAATVRASLETAGALSDAEGDMVVTVLPLGSGVMHIFHRNQTLLEISFRKGVTFWPSCINPETSRPRMEAMGRLVVVRNWVGGE